MRASPRGNPWRLQDRSNRGDHGACRGPSGPWSPAFATGHLSAITV